MSEKTKNEQSAEMTGLLWIRRSCDLFTLGSRLSGGCVVGGGARGRGAGHVGGTRGRSIVWVAAARGAAVAFCRRTGQVLRETHV